MKSSLPRILFASPHCLVDRSSGAAIATLESLNLLVRLGFKCKAFCASKLDLPYEQPIEPLMADYGHVTHTIEQVSAIGRARLVSLLYRYCKFFRQRLQVFLCRLLAVEGVSGGLTGVHYGGGVGPWRRRSVA